MSCNSMGIFLLSLWLFVKLLVLCMLSLLPRLTFHLTVKLVVVCTHHKIGVGSYSQSEWLHFHALEKEMATHSSVLAWRIPGTVEPGGLPSMRSHRVGHDWSDLAVAAAAIVNIAQQFCVMHSRAPWFNSFKSSSNFFTFRGKDKFEFFKKYFIL